MISDRLKQDLDRWLDGELPEEDFAQLQRELEDSPETVACLTQRAVLNELLARSSLGAAGSSVQRILTPPASRRWVMRTSIWAAAVITIVLASLALLPKAIASPAELVQQALTACQRLIDRRYTLVVEPNATPHRNPFRQRSASPPSTLWVRGERFVQIFNSSEGKLVWGRDAAGSLWFTTNGQAGAIFHVDDIPEVLEEVCELRTLDLQTLLENLLRDFELKSSQRKQGIEVIEARPQSNKQDAKFGRVELEIERGTSIVRRATLERVNNGRTVAVVSFKLEEVAAREDSTYELQTYLQPNAEVLDRNSRRGRRSELLREFIQRMRGPTTSKTENSKR